MDIGNNKPHWRDLPQKPHVFTTGFPHKINVICVGDNWDPSTSKLSVEGLTDVSETDGKALLASDVAKGPLPILRVFRVDEEIDEMEAFFALSNLEGEKVLGLIRRRDLAP
jgi:hypothetical protein